MAVARPPDHPDPIEGPWSFSPLPRCWRYRPLDRLISNPAIPHPPLPSTSLAKMTRWLSICINLSPSLLCSALLVPRGDRAGCGKLHTSCHPARRAGRGGRQTPGESLTPESPLIILAHGRRIEDDDGRERTGLWGGGGEREGRWGEGVSNYQKACQSHIVINWPEVSRPSAISHQSGEPRTRCFPRDGGLTRRFIAGDGPSTMHARGPQSF